MRWFRVALLVLLLNSGSAMAAEIDEGWDAVRRGEYGKAVAVFSELAGGGDADAMFALGWLYSRGQGVARDVEGGERWLSDAASLGHVEARTELGYLYALGLGLPRDRDRAEELDRLAAAAGSRTAINNLAYGWAEAGRNLDQALALLTPLLADAPDDSAVLDTFGWILYRMGRAGDALPPLCQAARREPGHPEILGHLGDALWRLGHRVEAQHNWRRALDLMRGSQALSEAGADFAASRAGESWLFGIRARLARGLPDGPGAAAPDRSDAPLPVECAAPTS